MTFLLLSSQYAVKARRTYMISEIREAVRVSGKVWNGVNTVRIASAIRKASIPYLPIGPPSETEDRKYIHPPPEYQVLISQWP
jgi:hypothetical protein